MKKTLSRAVSLAVVATLGLSSAARAQSTVNVSTVLDAASYGLLVKLPIRPEGRSDFLRIIKDRVAAVASAPKSWTFESLLPLTPMSSSHSKVSETRMRLQLSRSCRNRKVS